MIIDSAVTIITENQISSVWNQRNRVKCRNCLNPQPYTIHIFSYYSSI